MSSNNNERFMVLEERIREINLSEEEKAAFRKAKSQLQNHARLGAFAGLLVGGYASKVRKFNIGLSIVLCIGSVAVGGQIGFFTGTAAGIRTIKSLPDSQRIFDAIRDAKNFKQRPPSIKKQEQEGQEEQGGENDNLSDEFAIDNRNINDIGDESLWAKDESSPTPSQQNSDNYSSSWDKIRARNSASSAKQQKPTSDKYNGEPSSENLPRTREDFEELYGEGKIKTNKYGDAEIRYE